MILATLPETNIFAAVNGWLEDDGFLLGFGLFSGDMLVSGSVILLYIGKKEKFQKPRIELSGSTEVVQLAPVTSNESLLNTSKLEIVRIIGIYRYTQ